MYLLVSALCAVFVSCQKKEPLPWKLGAQSYTFHKFTFVETLDKLQELGLQYVEVYYGQRLGEGFGDQKMDFRMDKATQAKVLEAAKAKNVTIYASGVVICEDEQEWEDLFRFAILYYLSFIHEDYTACYFFGKIHFMSYDYHRHFFGC